MGRRRHRLARICRSPIIGIRFSSEIGKRQADSGTAWVYEELEFGREVLDGKDYAAHHPDVDFDFSFVVRVSLESWKELNNPVFKIQN